MNGTVSATNRIFFAAILLFAILMSSMAKTKQVNAQEISGTNRLLTIRENTGSSFESVQDEIIVNFFELAIVDGIKSAVIDFLNSNVGQLRTSHREFSITVDYVDDNGDLRLGFLPAIVLESNWEIPATDEDFISLIVSPNGDDSWDVIFEPDSESAIEALSTNFSFPWTNGQKYAKTQGFHSSTSGYYSLDFAPRNGASLNTLAIETGTLKAWCYTSLDPYQAAVRVQHANSITSGYLHLAKNSIISDKLNQSISKGTVIGQLYQGTDKSHNKCPNLSNKRFDTYCGCGTGAHLHFEVNSLITIQGNGLSSISSASNGTTYTSNNSMSPMPSPPAGVSATDGSSTEYVRISWNASSGATSYEVWRNTSSSSSGATKVATISSTTYNDTNTPPLVPHFFWIKACTSKGCSGFSSANAGYRGQINVVLLEGATLTPPYSGDMCGSAWHRISGFGDSKAYLTLNTNQSSQATNSGVWQPNLPTSGVYKIDAYVPLHGVINWQCPTKTIPYDTSQAKYTVYHAAGNTTVTKDQAPLSNAWLSLGTFTFNAGNGGKVKLVDLNSESNLTRTIAFSAMKFTLQPPSAFNKIGPANTAIDQPRNPTLSWQASIGNTEYEYCYDTMNNNTCDTSWVSNGASNSVEISGLTPLTTYYWQVRARNTSGGTDANGSTWWSFTTTNATTIKNTFQSTAAHDGWILESSETSNKGGTLNKGATILQIGDDIDRKQYLSILSFNTSSIPDDAVITKVTLRVKRQGVTGGGNPVNMFQGFMVDIKRGSFGAQALVIGDFQTSANKSYGPFQPTLSDGWYAINLTPGKNFVNKLASGNGLTQIRLRFKLDDNNNGKANFLKLFSGNAPAASRPQLIVEYYVP